MFEKFKKNQFLFEELVKRDFNKKYKKTALGVAWSLLSPLLTLLIMKLVFTTLFGISIPNYTTFLFAGNLVFTFFVETTNSGMSSFIENSGIFTKVNVPKYLFLFSKTVSSLINFAIILAIFFIFVALDGIEFSWMFLLIVFPIVCLTLFNLGVSFMLSSAYIFFKDMLYLWNLFTFALSYLSGIFYNVDIFPKEYQHLFLYNPLYIYIYYIRSLVIDAKFPDPIYTYLAIGYALVSLFLGCLIYVKNNKKFLYYV